MPWKLDKSKIKNYPHFDAPISVKDAESLANDPDRVANNTFYPLLRYYEAWQPFRAPSISNDRPKKKTRPISYCARRDAYIYMRYRAILSELYELKLREYGISDAPIAYRKIAKSPANPAGKSNIDFAKDVFDEIDMMGNAVAIALDIKGYFDNLDHNEIRKRWLELLGAEDLPPDHEAVYKSITNYRYAETKEVYRRLGFFGPKEVGNSVRDGYLLPKSEIPKQLCSNADFRKKIAGKGGFHSTLIKKNWKRRGIPQGSPISDILANLYLIDFDRKMVKFARRHGGSYRRYSDDILIIIPSEKFSQADPESYAVNQISEYGSHLVIKKSKTSVVEYRKSLDRQIFTHQSGEQGANGLEYLGFRYDGTEVFIRDTTISRYFRKIAVAARKEANYLIRKYPGEDRAFLMSKLNISVLLQRWDRVLKFKSFKNDPKKWTFRTYAKKAAETFDNGNVFLRQLKNTKGHLRSRVEQSLIKKLGK